MKRLLLSIVLSAASLFAFSQDTAYTYKVATVNYYADNVKVKSEEKTGTIYLINGEKLSVYFNIGKEKFSFVVDSLIGSNQSTGYSVDAYSGKYFKSVNKELKVVKCNLFRVWYDGKDYAITLQDENGLIEYIFSGAPNPKENGAKL